MIANQEILHIINIDSILARLKALIYEGWSPKLLFLHLLPSLATLGCLGHQFPDKLATKKILSPRVSYAGLSSNPPPNLSTFQRWSWEKSQAPALGPKLALPSPNLALPRVKPTSLSNYIFLILSPPCLG